MEIVLPEGARKDFSIKEAYGFGWQTTWANLGFLVGFTVLMGIIQYLPSFIPQSVQQQNPILSFVITIISWVISTITGIGYLKIGLRIANGEKGELSDLYSQWPLFLRFVCVSLLSGLAVIGGCLLLIIPGIILAIRLQFAPYLLIDKNTGIRESLNKSWKMTKGVTLKLMAFGLVGCLIILAGFLCLIVGLLVAAPVTLLASVYVYKKIVSVSGV